MNDDARPRPALADTGAEGDERLAPHLRMHAVRVFVRDLDRSLRFYCDQLVFVTDDVVAKFREWAKRGVRFRNVPRLRRIRYDRGVPAGSSATKGGEDEPALLLRSVNRPFYENTTAGAYATLFFAAYEDGPRRLRYANCGHLCGLLFRGDGTFERLETTGPVVGLFEEWDCTVGERRLIDAVRGAPDSPPQATIAAVVDGVRRFSPREQHDDITLIVARCRAA
jgi:catechol 2,3-dioxygenase-like lactoylglutathione lyase family enzyme